MNKRDLFFPLLLLACSPSISMAAPLSEQSRVYSVSSLTISLTIPEHLELIQPDRTHDWAFSPDLAADISQEVCVYTNGNPEYRITFAGGGDDKGFTASDGIRALDYRVLYKNGGQEKKDMRAGSTSSYFVQGNSGFRCNGSSNAQITISVDGMDNLIKNSIAYVGILTVQVAPE